MSEKTSSHPLSTIGGVLLASIVTGGVTGGAIGGVIINSQQAQFSRTNPIQATQQASPAPLTQESAQMQSVTIPENPPVAITQEPAQVELGNSRTTIPVETQVQPNLQAQTDFQTPSGNCAYPDDVDSRGRRCGKRSAYSRGPTTGYDSNR